MGWWAEELRKVLQDAVIVGVASDEEKGEEYIGILLEYSNGKQKVVWLLSDEEGNGAGRFTVSNVKSGKEARHA